jgi:putative tryptophan/tyrosine transport system substrate-binding protein
MRRREFIMLLGSAAAWPLAAHAQRAERARHIGILMNTAAENPEAQSGIKAFQQVLQQSGLMDGQNIDIDVRWGENDIERDRRYAAELVALAPDLLLASGTVSVTALQRATHTIPIVFVQVSDPVGAGVVDTLARPGGNATGFMNFEYTLSGKWLELLKQVAPNVMRVAVIPQSSQPGGNWSVQHHSNLGAIDRSRGPPR